MDKGFDKVNANFEQLSANFDVGTGRTGDESYATTMDHGFKRLEVLLNDIILMRKDK